MIRGEVAVLGLGNILFGDDGAGVAAVTELCRRFTLPHQVRVYDGGVLGLHLLGLLEDTDHLLVLDTVRAGATPGELVRLDGDRLDAVFAASLSVHEVGFGELLAAAQLRARHPEHLVVWGVEGEDVGPRLGLTPTVAGVVPALADAAAAELRSWGIPVTVRASPPAPRPYPEGELGLGGHLGATVASTSGHPAERSTDWG